MYRMYGFPAVLFLSSNALHTNKRQLLPVPHTHQHLLREGLPLYFIKPLKSSSVVNITAQALNIVLPLCDSFRHPTQQLSPKNAPSVLRHSRISQRMPPLRRPFT